MARGREEESFGLLEVLAIRVEETVCFVTAGGEEDLELAIQVVPGHITLAELLSLALGECGNIGPTRLCRLGLCIQCTSNGIVRLTWLLSQFRRFELGIG